MSCCFCSTNVQYGNDVASLFTYFMQQQKRALVIYLSYSIIVLLLSLKGLDLIFVYKSTEVTINLRNDRNERRII